MKIKKTSKYIAVAVSAATVLLTACSGGGGSSFFSGIAVDGYLANAKVCYAGTSICAITDSKGNFTLNPNKNLKTIMEPIYAADGVTSLTTDISTGLPYTSILSAPAGYPIITPLTTVLAESSVTVEELARELDLNASTAATMLKLDPLTVMNADQNASYSETQKQEATKIFAKGVVLEKQISVILGDKSTFNGNTTSTKLDDKSIVIKNLFTKMNEDNASSFDTLSSSDISTVYKNAVLEKNNLADVSSPKADTKASIIAQSAASLNTGLNDVNYSNSASGYNLAVQVGKTTDDLITLSQDLVDLNATSTDTIANGLAAIALNGDAVVAQAEANTLIASGVDAQEALTQAQSAKQLAEQKAASTITVNPAPTMILSTNSIITDTNSSDVNLTVTLADLDGSHIATNATTYSARIDNAAIVSFADGKSNLHDNNTMLNLTIKGSGATKLYITPVDNEGKYGLEQVVDIIVQDANIVSSPITLSTSISTHTFSSTIKPGVPDETKFDVNLTVTEGDSTLKSIVADSNDTDVVKVHYDGNRTLSLYPVYNGNANVTVTALDENNQFSTQVIAVNVSGVSLPPVLSFKKDLIEVVKNPSSSVNFTLEYKIEDPDPRANQDRPKYSSNSNYISCAENNATSAICTIDSMASAGTYSVNATPNNFTLDGKTKKTTVEVFEGNVAPKLQMSAPTAQTINVMETIEIPYTTTDLNQDDNVTVTATSSDTSIVNVLVDANKSVIKVTSLPKVGTSIVSVHANDGQLNSTTKNITFTTKNELDALIQSLRVVPIMDQNDVYIDNRYKMTNFSLSYDIAANEITLNGDVNSTGFSLSNATMIADANQSLYYTDTRNEAFIIKMDITQSGQPFQARVLAYSTKVNNVATTPFLWALATPTEICNAYKNNTTILDDINSFNSNPVDCSK